MLRKLTGSEIHHLEIEDISILLHELAGWTRDDLGALNELVYGAQVIGM